MFALMLEKLHLQNRQVFLHQCNLSTKKLVKVKLLVILSCNYR